MVPFFVLTSSRRDYMNIFMGYKMYQNKNCHLQKKLEHVFIIKGIDTKFILQILLLAVIYFITAKLGIAMAMGLEPVTVIWPPSGIVLASLLLFGPQLWPGVTLGAFFAEITSGEPIATALAIAIGNTMEAIIAIFLLRNIFKFNHRLGRVKDVLCFALAIVIGSLFASTIGAVSLCAGGVLPWYDFWRIWLKWLLGDTSGALLVATPLLLWLSVGISRIKFPPKEAIILFLGFIFISAFVFSWEHHLDSEKYLIFPFIIWAALRFGTRGTIIIIICTAMIAILSVLYNIKSVEPMGQELISTRLVLIQIFMIVATMTGMLLASAVNERLEAEKNLQETRERVKLITDHALYAIIASDKDGQVMEWNHQAENMFGWTSEEAIGKNIGELIVANELVDKYEIGTHQFFEILDSDMLNKCVEIVAKNKCGNVFPISVTSTHQRIQSKDYFTIFARSLYEQVVIEEMNELFSAIMESSQDAIISEGLDGTILSWNSSAENLLGYKKEEVMGMNIREIIHPGYEQHDIKIISGVRGGKYKKSHNTIFVAKDGHNVEISMNVYPIMDKTGQIIGISRFVR